MKTICVPKDAAAQNRLDYNEHTVEDLFELQLDDTSFYKLWELSFFHDINQIADTLIDDFESEEIIDEEKLKSVMESGVFEKGRYSTKLYGTVKKIEELFKTALDRETGVFFFF